MPFAIHSRTLMRPKRLTVQLASLPHAATLLLMHTLAITMGDPAGIGPEIIAKAFARPRPLDCHQRWLVVGDLAVMQRAVAIIKAHLQLRPIQRPEDAVFDPATIDVLTLPNLHLENLQLGQVSAAAGNAAFQAVRTAIELAMARRVDAVVTAPLHKEALHLAGHHFPGHTEIFAHYTHTPSVAMMLAAGELRVVHVSTHVSLRQACDCVTRSRVGQTIRLAHAACQRLGIPQPTIGVAGLNPHAGDGGLFGTEDHEHIVPAIEDARREGLLVEGPLPADTFFAKAIAGAWDVCIAMYHDQGHIPVKMKGFRFDVASNTWTSVSGINVSLGLPIIRTSVDHGTAFDQAGKGTASEESLLCALDYAQRLARSESRL